MRATLFLRANMTAMFKWEGKTEGGGRCGRGERRQSVSCSVLQEAAPELRQVVEANEGSETSPGGGTGEWVVESRRRTYWTWGVGVPE